MRLREARQRAGLSERALARILKVHVSHVHGLENGEHLPSGRLWERLRSLFPGVELDIAGPDACRLRSNARRLANWRQQHARSGRATGLEHEEGGA